MAQLWPDPLRAEMVFGPACECPQCGTLHTPVRWHRGQRRYTISRQHITRSYAACSPECRRAWDAARLRARREANQRKPRAVYITSCLNCSTTFTSGRIDARFCSDRCRAMAYRRFKNTSRRGGGSAAEPDGEEPHTKR